ncbi:molybdate ABC transporter substrate-binding protein [Nakamurella flava]|uniref:Molybdate ABC transporter substrate-binding protein n=1 Tax=Nakamurella flava TaxID=2576308 RepID=A0A4U6QGJ2_9ACTN|nr:molybdate ABC transporter substrate-binding protein [Nakamurella flava]TKV59281.1 molybdate ABC transporter substrate-binding protein [Nakamurella flava]
MSRPPSTRLGRGVLAAGAAVGLAVLTACGSGGSTAAPAGTPATSVVSAQPADAGGTLTVFAAASLKGSFTALGETFEEQNPGTTVTFNFAGSSDLVTQLTAGAPADVFASADQNNMRKATDAGVISGSPVDFASNTLTIVTAPGNPRGISGLADLTRPDLQVVVCAPQVPCGSATEKLEKSTTVTLTPVSEESSVTDVLNKVQTGQADAGLVYVTDARGAGDKVTAVAVPEASSVVNVYPIATLTAAAQPELATEFVALVTGSDGRKVLSDAGFQPAP